MKRVVLRVVSELGLVHLFPRLLVYRLVVLVLLIVIELPRLILLLISVVLLSLGLEIDAFVIFAV